MTELTIDKCVLVHCVSSARDAAQYRACSLEFLEHWRVQTSFVACVNGGIRKEYSGFPPIGVDWWRSVVGQSRYREKRRAIAQPQRVTFRQRKHVPLHGEDFDYVDAASQSTSQLWLCNETTWQNSQFQQRIQAEYQVEIKNVNQYMGGVRPPTSAGSS